VTQPKNGAAADGIFPLGGLAEICHRKFNIYTAAKFLAFVTQVYIYIVLKKINFEG